MELHEEVRRWQAGESRRAIASALGLARMTVEKYVRAAEAASLRVHGPPAEDQVVALGRANRPGCAPGGSAPQQGRLAAYQEQIAHWLTEERLQLTRVPAGFSSGRYSPAGGSAAAASSLSAQEMMQ
jgi:hypothetical protein